MTTTEEPFDAIMARVTGGDTTAILHRAWDLHEEIVTLITTHTMRLIATEILKEMPTARRVILGWEEGSEWSLVLADADGSEVDSFDLAEQHPHLWDFLASNTPHIWETSPRLLQPYTVDGLVETDETFGMLERAEFLVERMLAGARSEEDQRTLEEATLAAQREARRQAREG